MQIHPADKFTTNGLFLAELGLSQLQSSLTKLRSAYEKQLAQRLARRGPGRLRAPDRIGAGDLELLREYHRAGKPVVIEGLYEHWPARQRWTMEFFRDTYGEREFEINVQNTRNRRTDFKSMNLRDIIDSFDQPDGDLNYIMFSPILEIIPELNEDVDLGTVRRFAGLGESRRMWVKLFLGPANTKTSLHMAPQSNLFFQVRGKKRWVMFPPDQSALIYTNRILPTGLPYFFSNYAHRDEGRDPRYPLAEFLDGYDIQLDSGDALWVPPFHWHWVHAQTPSISLTTWWYDPLISLRASPFYFALSVPGLLGILSGRYDVDEFDRERTATIKRVVAAVGARQQQRRRERGAA